MFTLIFTKHCSLFHNLFCCFSLFPLFASYLNTFLFVLSFLSIEYHENENAHLFLLYIFCPVPSCRKSSPPKMHLILCPMRVKNKICNQLSHLVFEHYNFFPKTIDSEQHSIVSFCLKEFKKEFMSKASTERSHTKQSRFVRLLIGFLTGFIVLQFCSFTVLQFCSFTVLQFYSFL
jgi:hypothetical protein